MKNDKIINVWDKMKPCEEIKQEILNDITQKQQKRSKLSILKSFKPAKIIATAAALIFCFIFGHMLINPQNGNSFALKAYAMEQQEDGSIEMREVDLMEDMQAWSGCYDGENLFMSINLKCEGENIKSVDFYTDEGFFAKQYLKIIDGKIVLEDGVPASFGSNGDGTYTITMYGDDFEKIGSSFTLNKDDMTDDLLLFLGTPVTNWLETPTQMTIRAVATFNDGKTQEETLVIDRTKGLGLIRGKMDLTEEKMFGQFGERANFEITYEIDEEIADENSVFTKITVLD